MFADLLRIHCFGSSVLQVFICGSTADRQRARRSIWQINCGPVGFCRSTAGQLALYLVDRWRASWVLRIHCFTCVCGSTAGLLDLADLLRIYRGSVGFCGSPAGPLDLADPLFYRCLFEDRQCARRSIWQINRRPVGFCRSTAGHLALYVADRRWASWVYRFTDTFDPQPNNCNQWARKVPAVDPEAISCQCNSGSARINRPAVDPQRNTYKQWARNMQRPRSRSAVHPPYKHL